MKDSTRALVWTLGFLTAVAAAAGALFEPLRDAFLANRVFNGLIIGVLLVGIAVNLRQQFRVGAAANWLDAFQSRDAQLAAETRPPLLAPMSSVLSSVRKEGFRLSAQSLRSVLDAVRLRLEEALELSRYLTGLLIFLGLLGTFWGLLDTVRSVGGVIDALDAGSDLGAAFDRLKGDLQGPLAGMGTAFSSSLFGLAGALVLGFMELMSGQAQNRFYNRLEEWLDDWMHLPSSALGSVDGGGSVPSYIEALLEQTADNLAEMQRALMRGEDERRATGAALTDMADKLSMLNEHMRAEQKVLTTLARQQQALQPALARLAEGFGDDPMREHLRNVDVGVQRLVQETAASRSEMVSELRGELRLLTRTLAQATDDRTRGA